MRILAFIKVKVPSITISIDDSDSPVPFSAPFLYPDPDYPDYMKNPDYTC